MRSEYFKSRFLILVMPALLAATCIPSVCEARKKSPRHRSVRQIRHVRQVAMAFRKTTPPMLVTYFTAGSVPEGGGGGQRAFASAQRKSAVYLGGGVVGMLARDSAFLPGTPLRSYGGLHVQGLWQAHSPWIVRGSVGYVSRTFSPAQDASGGQGQVGQFWSANLAVEYEWLNSDGFRLSSGLGQNLGYGYRSRGYVGNPTYGQRFFYKAGVSALARYEVSAGVDVYADGQWLFGFGAPWESQGIGGIGILFGL